MTKPQRRVLCGPFLGWGRGSWGASCCEGVSRRNAPQARLPQSKAWGLGYPGIPNPHDHRIHDRELDRYYLLLVDYPVYAGNDIQQFAGRSRAIVHTVDRYRRSLNEHTYESSYVGVVIHELGHGLFGFGHPPDCSVMGIGYFVCPHLLGPYDYTSVARLLGDMYVGCRDRRTMGWPEDSEQCREPLREPVRHEW